MNADIWTRSARPIADRPDAAIQDLGEASLTIAHKTIVKPRQSIGSLATVTVVIPCYNYARYLPQAISSALAQEGVIVDVVVVDDASTDESFEVATAFADCDTRVRVLQHTTNSGPVDTFNDGLAVAEGEFLVRLDADDLLTPGSLRRAIDVMRSFPSIGLVYGHPIHFDGNRLPSPRTVPTHWTMWPGREWLADRCESGYNVITSPEVLMRRSIVDQVGGQKALAHTHDMEMWLRLSAFSDVAYINGVDQAWHREHSRSLSATEVDSLRDFQERRAAFEVLFDGPVGNLYEAAQLRAAATHALATYCVEASCRCYDHIDVNLERVELFSQYARELIPDVTQIPGWQGLQWRMAVGAGAAAYHPVFVLERLRRGLATRWRKLRWHRQGY
ncbi:glycosyltransferase [Rhizobiaceae bacterium n13]|uniref:Glycosyltransferase n=1 Tax=Ferirhizobium litorale TaxID=2927786 RepID=A0AAE3QBK6_9HYPH|nr:glycosyltransferase family 2 protein [Fererhizobium litorale]MDI7860717.1 glycosyltransferase [Fererhizobium litorale]MDI7920865.1 glycosyltransferase [Fererhizobium litorale]